MRFSFSNTDFDTIAHVLGTTAKHEGEMVRFDVIDPNSGRKLILEIHPALEMPSGLSKDGYNFIAVSAINSVMQLHNCTGMVASAEMGEVIFFAKQNGMTNGLVVERGAGCSLYANIEDRLLSTDFTQLPPEVMMCSVALSMTEDLFNDLP
jgi:hypothetical protein